MTSKVETSPPPPSQENLSAVFQLMLRINRLNLKAFSAKTFDAFKFIILNDTVYVVRYDRAVLWDLTKGKPAVIGISSQSKVNKDAEIIQKWQEFIQAIPDISKAQQITSELFKQYRDKWNELQKQTKSSVLWLPIIVGDKPVAGLWLEKWEAENEQMSAEVVALLCEFLMKGYAAAWEKFTQKLTLKKLGIDKYKMLLVILVAMLLLFIIPVPLRVVAQCEVIPKDPVLITAPLDGIIEQVVVHPGDQIKKGDVVFEYDKRAPLHDLKVAQKEVQIIQAEINRATAMGLADSKSLAELGVLKLKLEKEQVQLDLARYYASRLTMTSPADGVVTLDNPEEWRGKPVKIGEKVMMIGDPNKTKIRIWLPEDDNIALRQDKPITIFLNVDPEKKREAFLEYIANESTVNEKNITSFIAEANWVGTPRDVKLGLKGTAVLYGPQVSLFYYIMRKPWATLRHATGW